eukprot:gene220-401_t
MTCGVNDLFEGEQSMKIPYKLFIIGNISPWSMTTCALSHHHKAISIMLTKQSKDCPSNL